MDVSKYNKTKAYAVEHGIMEEYLNTRDSNVNCRIAISEAINSNYSTERNRLDTVLALNELVEKFPLGQVAFVIAVTIQWYEHDFRISQDNKEWAKGIFIKDDIDSIGADKNFDFVLKDVHPGLINIFTNAVRREI